MQAVDLPGQWGYIHLKALGCIVSGSFLGVLIGVALANKVNALLLKRIFAVTLLGAGIKIAASAWGIG
jgi:uncharacterized membrane protein YfcA